MKEPPTSSIHIELLNEDCVQAMARYPDKYFDLACVDPPYGAGDTIFDLSRVVGNATSTFEQKKWNNTVPDKSYWEHLFRVSKNAIVWGGNYFVQHLPPSRGWIVWDKKYQGMHSFASAELAFTTFDRNAEMFSWRKPEAKIHPCQKPVKLYEWILANYAKPGQRILDTHLGSGSSAIAAYNMGFVFVGMELDADYYAAAVNRFEQHKSQLRLFGPDSPYTSTSTEPK